MCPVRTVTYVSGRSNNLAGFSSTLSACAGPLPVRFQWANYTHQAQGRDPFEDVEGKLVATRKYNPERKKGDSTGRFTPVVKLTPFGNLSEYGLGDELQVAITHQAAARLAAKHYMYAEESIALVALQARRALVRRPSWAMPGVSVSDPRATYEIQCATRMLVA
jgi:hypothetical protein